MALGLAKETADVYCPTCMCLGYSNRGSHQNLRPQTPTVLPGRSYHDFKGSAERGCFFCDVVLQSFLLLQNVAPEMRVELVLYAESPAELHAPGWKSFHEVVEIYPCSSKFTSLASLNETHTSIRC